MSQPADATSQPSSASSRGCLRGFIITAGLFILALALLGWFFLGSLKQAAAWLAALPAQIVQQDINTTFRESITRVSSTNGDILEVATLETNETVTRYDMKTALSDLVYLGTTVSEIRTPVVYRYHIRLSDDWRLQVTEGRCIVHAPAVRASTPPAIRTDGMEKKSEAGWLRFNAAENLAELEKQLTPTLERRAGNQSHINSTREAARKSVGEFVKKWLLQQQPTAADIHSLTVLFPDEVKSQKGPLTLPPTLQW